MPGVACPSAPGCLAILLLEERALLAELLTFLLLLLPPPSLLLLLLLDARVALKGQRPQAIGTPWTAARRVLGSRTSRNLVNNTCTPRERDLLVAVSNVLQYALDKRDVNRDH